MCSIEATPPAQIPDDRLSFCCFVAHQHGLLFSSSPIGSLLISEILSIHWKTNTQISKAFSCCQRNHSPEECSTVHHIFLSRAASLSGLFSGRRCLENGSNSSVSHDCSHVPRLCCSRFRLRAGLLAIFRRGGDLCCYFPRCHDTH